MKRSIPYLLFIVAAILQTSCVRDKGLQEAFHNPENKYRPMPFWHINGELTTAGIKTQITEAKELSGFGGVTVLPVNPHQQWGTGLLCPGTEPLYLSNAYFDRYSDILTTSKELGTEVILYDDIDFPSGTAGGRLQKEYPKYTRKQLVKHEVLINGPRQISEAIPDTSQLLMAVSAMNLATLEVINLEEHMQDTKLIWNVPAGKWRIMFFTCQYNTDHLVDFMQPEAVSKVISMTYDEYAKRFSQYFGNVITKTFYDDVGFVHKEETWTPAITDIFEKKYGKDPALYYPALYYDIGPETQAARVAFFDIRSELIAEGYVKQVAQWSAKNNLKSMGHPPENYSPNSVAANGDILKYYRHTQIPLMDAIFFYGRGIHGYKQISSAADLGDKPVVGAEIYGAFPANTDSSTLYRVAMEVMARGINFIVPHGMWYNTDADKIRIPPLISHQNPLLGKSLPHYSTWVARSSMMLQGGTRVSEIAMLWPITAIQAETYINRDKESGLPVANWLPEHVDHHKLSDLLTNKLRRDFTFVHPEDLCNGKITAEGNTLNLNNKENRQQYKVLIIPGGEVISAGTLKAIKQYYDGGGKVIATSLLPGRSSEFGQDHTVQEIINEMFGVNPVGYSGQDILNTNSQSGQAAFVKNADRASLDKVFQQMNIDPDIAFAGNIPSPEKGYLNYIHKQKEGKEIYFIANSTDNTIHTEISVRGNIKPEFWNPYSGQMQKITAYQHVQEHEHSYTRFELSLPGVSSVFVVGNQK